MAKKLSDGTVLSKHWKNGFAKGPPTEFVIECFGRIANGKEVEACTLGTTACGYREYPVRFTEVTVTGKGQFAIVAVFDYESAGRPAGSKSICGKKIAFNYNSGSRQSTEVYVEEGV